MELQEEIEKELERTERRRDRKKASYDDWQFLTGKINGLETALEIIKKEGGESNGRVAVHY